MIITGADILFGTDDDDVLAPEPVDYDTVIFGSAHGLAGDDVLIGSAAKDFLFGEDDDDVLLGRAGDDMLEGGAGEDVLKGGRGDDWLIGGEGQDWLKGGKGEDVFVVDFEEGPPDFIRDFKPGEDLLEIYTEKLDSVVIYDEETGRLTLDGETAAWLKPGLILTASDMDIW